MGLVTIGDVHGCLKTLQALLDRIGPAPDDHLVFIGDYIDRGPDSKGVIDFLLQLRERFDCTFLRGNHEAFMLDYLDYGAFDQWRVNGGLQTLESYTEADRKVIIPPEHEQFVRETLLVHDTPDFCFVHAGLRPEYTVEKNLQMNDEEVFLWERTHLKAVRYNWEKTVVCGHTPVREPVNEDKLINIDTGCVYHRHPDYGRLTAVRLPERVFTSVPYSG